VEEYENAGAFLGDFCLGLIHSFLILRPFLQASLEELSESFLGLIALLLDVPECAKRAVLVAAVFLDEAVLPFL
jgi:hypothetical protein